MSMSCPKPFTDSFFNSIYNPSHLVYIAQVVLGKEGNEEFTIGSNFGSISRNAAMLCETAYPRVEVTLEENTIALPRRIRISSSSTL